MKTEFSFKKRLTSMLKVDFRRMFTMSLYYLMVGIALVVPILILVMTTMMEGQVTINPTTQEETIMHGFDNVWQSLGSISGSSQGMSMDLVSMCNIDMMFFAVAVLVCIFISDDFRSGYSKNLFTVRSNKVDYVISKTLVGFVVGASMIITYFIGALIGGKISGLSFALEGINFTNIIMCVLSKVFLVLVFVPIFVVMSVVGKRRLWLSLIGGFGISMLLFTMVSMISPLDSTIVNVILTLVGGLLFSVGIGAISKIILNKTSLV